MTYDDDENENDVRKRYSTILTNIKERSKNE
jgi:hypothetical protein